NRIEEHGLHIWAGFYDEPGRSPEAPLATWQDAFKPHSYTTIEERVGDSYAFWYTDLPTNDGVPGDGGEFPSLWDYVCMMIESMIDTFKSHPLITQADAEPHHHILPEWLHSIVEECEDRLSNEGEKLGLFARLRFHPGPAANPAGASSLPAPIENQAVASGPDSSGNPRMRLLEAALKTASSLPADPAQHPASHHKAVLWMLEEFMAWFKGRVEGEIEEHAELRHTYLRTDLIMAITRGIIGDELIFKGLDSIDGEEWSDWLRRHGASEFTLSSPLVRGLYDYVFAYLDGDTARRASAAGTNLYGLFRLMCTFKGAFFYKMQAGMGDTVFGPLYEVLKRRGVRFKFFHRVLSLGLSEDKNSIAEIRISRQVNLKGGDYYPLFDVKGLPCWPSVPLYDQIVEGEELKSRKIDLESAWTP
ncbi:MAG TPA: hypothetical protein VNO14_14215, partial [Blastocatellia bacterium]|nr:hypothetical protein [Blastocatellia bacterium]